MIVNPKQPVVDDILPEHHSEAQSVDGEHGDCKHKHHGDQDLFGFRVLFLTDSLVGAFIALVASKVAADPFVKLCTRV